MEQGRGEVVEGALAALAPVALTPGPVVVLAPRIDIVTVTPGTLQWAIFPPQCVDIERFPVGYTTHPRNGQTILLHPEA